MGLEHNKTWFLGFGLFGAERGIQDEKNFRRALEGFGHFLQHSAGPQQKGFFYPFFQVFASYPSIHEDRAGCAVSITAGAWKLCV